MKLKRTLTLSLAALTLTGTLAGCAGTAGRTAPDQTPATPKAAITTALPAAAPAEISAPKYVFLFIGDGMSYPQFQVASDYLGAVSDTNNDKILDGNVPLTFMNFPVAGSAVTYDSSSFCPDSASTATSLSTGNKTYSGTINMDETAMDT